MGNFKDAIDAAAAAPASIFHRYRLERDRAEVHLFCEANDDIIVYSAFTIRMSVSAQFYDCGNKEGVLSVLDLINKQFGHQRNVCAVVDRDFDIILSRQRKDKSIYYTDGYSLENFFRIDEVMDHMVCYKNGRDPSCAIYQGLLRSVEEAVGAARRVLVTITRIALYARQKGIGVQLNNVDAGKYLLLDGKIEPKRGYVADYIKSICIESPQIDLKDFVNSTKKYRNCDFDFVRGKYYADVLKRIYNKFVQREAIRKITPRGRARRPMVHSWGAHVDIFEVIAVRMPIPVTFERFVRDRVVMVPYG